MSETAKIHLVRCPKCENLLPEVTDYSVYQCGGCGAVLRANNKGVDLDTFSEASDEEKVGDLGVLKEKFSEKCEKRKMELSDGSESGGTPNISSSSRAERRGAFRDRAENYRNNLMNKEEKWKAVADVIQDKKSDDLRRAKIGQDFEGLTLYNENRVVDGRNGDRSEMEGFRRAQIMDAEGMRYTNSIFSEEGPSNSLFRSSYDYENQVKNRNEMDGFNNADYVREDRLELLKKLDELKDQLIRSDNLNDKGKEKAFLDWRMAHQDPYTGSENWYPEKSLGVYPDSHFNRPLYQDPYGEPSPLMHKQEMGGNNFYTPRYMSSRVEEYGVPSRSQMFRRGPFQTPAPYQQPPSYQYISGPYRDAGLGYMDPVEPYHPNVNRHHPSCSCFQCCRVRQVPFPVQPTAFNDKFSDAPTNTLFNYHENPGSSGSSDYNSRITNPPLRSHNPPLPTRWPSDVNSEVDGFIGQRPPKVHLASVGLCCRPIAGGSPFFTCYNCFELLILPEKVSAKGNSRKKIKCGACSTVIVFAFSNNKFVVCVDVEAVDVPVKVDNNSRLSPTHGESHVRRHLNQARATFSSDDFDYDNADCDFHSMDKEPGKPSFGQGRANNSSEIKHRHSTSTHTIETEEDTESVNVVREDSNLADWATKNKGLPPPAGSSLQDHFEYSNKFHAMKKLGEKNRSGRTEFDKALTNKSATRQISTNYSSASEIDILSNEFSNTRTSFDSGKSSRQGSRAAGSFFADIIKKNFKELNTSNQNVEQEKASVTVNGHLMPDQIVKKAENMAGRIQPGNYWYDYRAGFWGVMGGPCLGIIPPHIEEFNYPMPENCADGNTDVFVNGRELNQKDMKLLKSRGLPTTRDRSYAIEISGKVIDNDTGEELKSLGKLAPSIERVQRGYGMRVPKKAAS